MIDRPPAERSLLALLGSALRRTARIATERPRAALWTLLALTSALFAVAVAATTAASLDQWAQARPGAAASMVIYLGEGIDDTRAQTLVGELRALRGVERAELVPAAESARRLVGALGADAALLEGVDVAALPASVEVSLAPGVRDVVALSPTVRALRAADGVADIVVEDAQDDRIAGALGTLRAVAWAGAALFAGLALMIVLAAIRVRLDPGRAHGRWSLGGDELVVAQLLGAGPSFLVFPTALAGALSGVLAALLAVAALAAGLHAYGDAIAHALAPALGAVELLAPSPAQIALFVALGAGLGTVGGALAGASRVAR